MKHLDLFEIEYEDEVGIWIGLEQKQTTVTAEEQEHRQKRRKLSSKNPEDHASIAEVQEEAGGGQTQTRGPEGKGEDKRRVTLLHRMFLQHTVQMKDRRLKPKGKLGRTAIVLPGAHCCADFFSFDQNGVAVWNRNWSVEYMGVLKEYWKGDKVGNMMLQAQVLKKAFPQYFEMFMVFQQPAAMRDGAIVAWCMEEMHVDHPYVMQQHDLLGAQSTSEVKELRFLLNQPDAVLCGEMTAPCQVTDIMIAEPVHAVARWELPKIRQWLKENAMKRGSAEVKYRVGLLEILMICEAIEKYLRQWLEDYDFILAAARMGGHLAYLPDLEQGKLVRMEEAAQWWPMELVKVKDGCQRWWPKEMQDEEKQVPWKVPPLGGGKLDADWLKDRYSWRDANGKPLKPVWEEQDKAYEEKLESLIAKQKQFHNEEAKILVTAEEQEIFDQHADELQKHPSVRKMQYTLMWEALREAGESNIEAKTISP